MFPSSFAGNSHRGVDLGPSRLSMPGGLLRRPFGQTGNGGRSDIATASLAVRYGSGARLPSRDRERDRGGARRRDGVFSTPPVFNESNVDAVPAGPAAQQEWIDALNSFTNRIETIERNVRSHAALISKTDERLIENHSRANELSAKIDAVIKKADANTLHLEQACTNINDKFATSANTELAIGQVLEQFNNLNREFQMLANLVSSGPQDSGPTPVAINTPVVSPEKPSMAQQHGDAYAPGPGGGPLWSSSLPPPAVPANPMPAFPLTQRSSPLRSQDQPYVAPQPDQTAPAPTAHGQGVRDNAGCLHSDSTARNAGQLVTSARSSNSSLARRSTSATVPIQLPAISRTSTRYGPHQTRPARRKSCAVYGEPRGHGPEIGSFEEHFRPSF